MSIQRGLARNREVYRLLFAEEADPLPPLPDGEDSFRESAAAVASQQSAYRLDAPYPLTAPDIHESYRDTATSPTAAEAAAQALLRRLDDEARLYAQDLEEE